MAHHGSPPSHADGVAVGQRLHFVRRRSSLGENDHRRGRKGCPFEVFPFSLSSLSSLSLSVPVRKENVANENLVCLECAHWNKEGDMAIKHAFKDWTTGDSWCLGDSGAVDDLARVRKSTDAVGDSRLAVDPLFFHSVHWMILFFLGDSALL